MQNLVVNHIYLTLGIAGLVSVILTGCAIEAGDVLHRRFQRKALERELKKVSIPLVAICLAFSLLTSQLAFGQTPTQLTPAEIRTDQYQKLLDVTNGFLLQVQKICKTEACQQAATDGLELLADAREKHKNGQLWQVQANRKDFHRKLEAILTKAHSALMEDVAAKRALHKGNAKLDLPTKSCPIPAAKTAALKTDGKFVLVGGQTPNPEMCQECKDTFATLVDICGLYFFAGSPEAVLICIAAAAIGFARCVDDWCSASYKEGYSDE